MIVIETVRNKEEPFALVADFTGENKTFTRQLKIKPAKSEGVQDRSGVCISSDVAHQTAMLRTIAVKNLVCIVVPSNRGPSVRMTPCLFGFHFAKTVANGERQKDTMEGTKRIQTPCNALWPVIN